MRRLAIIPTIRLISISFRLRAGWLKGYFNPARFFDEVYSLSPSSRWTVPGRCNPRADAREQLRPDFVARREGGSCVRRSHPCDIACDNKVRECPSSYPSRHRSDMLPPRSQTPTSSVRVGAVRRLVRPVPQRRSPLDSAQSCGLRSHEAALTRRDSAPRREVPVQAPNPPLGRRCGQKNLDNLIRALRFWS